MINKVSNSAVHCNHKMLPITKVLHTARAIFNLNIFYYECSLSVEASVERRIKFPMNSAIEVWNVRSWGHAKYEAPLFYDPIA